MMATCVPWRPCWAAFSKQMPDPPQVTSAAFSLSTSAQNGDSIAPDQILRATTSRFPTSRPPWTNRGLPCHTRWPPRAAKVADGTTSRTRLPAPPQTAQRVTTRCSSRHRRYLHAHGQATMELSQRFRGMVGSTGIRGKLLLCSFII
jgi:hypothetical protein